MNNKNPLVSVIIPTLNSEKNLEKCLKSIEIQSFKNIEIIVVDNNSTDKTNKIARKYTRKVYNLGPERSAQRNYGIRKSKGEYLLIIDSDMYLYPKVIEEGIGIFTTHHSTKCLVIPEETIAQGFWGRCKKFERDFYIQGDRSAEAARFFRKKELLEADLYDESLTGGEDWELNDRFIKRYPDYGRTESRIIHDEGYVTLGELYRKKQYYSKFGHIKHFREGAPIYRKIPYLFRPSVIKQWYRFIQHPVIGAGSIFMKFIEGLYILTH